MPNKTVLATSLDKMTNHGDVFKMKLLMYLISSVFAPTTSLRSSNKCFPVSLMYVDHLDLSTVDIDVLGGPPSPHKFVFSMWAYSFVGEHTHRPTGCRGRYDYNSSHELPKTQEELFGDGYGGMDAGPAKDDHDDTENVQHGSGRMKSREAPAGECNRKAPDVVPPLKGGNVSTFASDAVVSPSKRGRTTKDGA
uniref:Uncharacterized protein n=1 Tax=Hordeum vulgare subsp. vulgare TaxID=112509 RepID=A0A8I7BDU5_HORVV